MYKKVIDVLNKAVVKNIKVYDMKNLTPFYDYSIICSVNTARQGVAAVNYLKKAADQMNLNVRSFSTSLESSWYLIDLNDVVIHLFVGEERFKYNLDGMYGDHPILYIE